MAVKLALPVRPKPRPTGAKPAAATPAPKPSPAEQAALAAQAWLPIRDLRDGMLVRADGALVAGLAIAPYSLALKSSREQTQVVGALTEALNGLDCPWQWLSLYRPVDLNAYLAQVDNTLQVTQQGPRRTVLADYLRWATGMVRAGEVVERKYYLLLTRTGPDAIGAHQTTLIQLTGAMHAIRGFRAVPLDDAAWRELLFLAFHSEQAAWEPVPDGLPRQAPVFRLRRETVYVKNVDNSDDGA
jgi:hypothetical protein